MALGSCVACCQRTTAIIEQNQNTANGHIASKKFSCSFVLGNSGARGKQEHGGELCAEFLGGIFARAQSSLAMLPFEVF